MVAEDEGAAQDGRWLVVVVIVRVDRADGGGNSALIGGKSSEAGETSGRDAGADEAEQFRSIVAEDAVRGGIDVIIADFADAEVDEEGGGNRLIVAEAEGGGAVNVIAPRRQRVWQGVGAVFGNVLPESRQIYGDLDVVTQRVIQFETWNISLTFQGVADGEVVGEAGIGWCWEEGLNFGRHGIDAAGGNDVAGELVADYLAIGCPLG